jgi:hypothetical protein
MAKVLISDLLNKQFDQGYFTRMTLIVKLLAIENYYQKNQIGWEIYKKVHPPNKDKDFKELIETVEKDGYYDLSFIIIDKKFHILDGNHRLAMLLYSKSKYVNIVLMPYEYNNDTRKGTNELKENYGLNENEIKIVLDKFNEIKETYKLGD